MSINSTHVDYEIHCGLLSLMATTYIHYYGSIITTEIASLYSGHPWDSFKCPD